VAEVEGVIGLAARISPTLAAFCTVALAAVAAAPWLVTRDAHADLRRAGSGLSILFFLWAAAPAFGAFPVPLVGVGLSPIVGAWLSVGLLAGLARRGT
jgi:hypothetical protein